MIPITAVLLLLCSHDVIVYGQTVVEGVIGGSVVLPCTLTHQGDLQWKGGGTVILVKSANGNVIIPDSIWEGDVSLVGESDLEIRSLGRGRDEGKTITCSYTGGAPTQQIQIKLLAPITGVQILEASNGKVTVTAGTLKTLSCSVSGDPSTPIYYAWEVNGNFVSEQNSATFSLTANKNTTTVGCRAYNRYSNKTELSSQNVTVTLNVLYLETPHSNTPINVTEGQNVTINCSAEGNPKPMVQWLNSTVIKSNPYTIKTVNRSDSGIYICRANNSVGTKDISITINVNYPPDVTVKYDEASQTLTCIAKGIPDVYNFSRWEHRLDGKLLQYLGTPSTVTQSPVTLKLSSPTYKDTGNYICQVTNGIKSKQMGQLFIAPQTTKGRLSVKFYAHPVLPNITVKWTKSGDNKTLTTHHEADGCVTLVIRRQNVSINGNVTVLTLENISESDEGNYTVTVTNYVNTTSSVVSVTIVNATGSEESPFGDGPNVALIAGGAIGGVVVLMVIITLIVIVLKRRSTNKVKKRKSRASVKSQNGTPNKSIKEKLDHGKRPQTDNNRKPTRSPTPNIKGKGSSSKKGNGLNYQDVEFGKGLDSPNVHPRREEPVTYADISFNKEKHPKEEDTVGQMNSCKVAPPVRPKKPGTVNYQQVEFDKHNENSTVPKRQEPVTYADVNFLNDKNQKDKPSSEKSTGVTPARPSRPKKPGTLNYQQVEFDAHKGTHSIPTRTDPVTYADITILKDKGRNDKVPSADNPPTVASGAPPCRPKKPVALNYQQVEFDKQQGKPSIPKRQDPVAYADVTFAKESSSKGEVSEVPPEVISPARPSRPKKPGVLNNQQVELGKTTGKPVIPQKDPVTYADISHVQESSSKGEVSEVPPEVISPARPSRPKKPGVLNYQQVEFGKTTGKPVIPQKDPVTYADISHVQGKGGT